VWVVELVPAVKRVQCGVDGTEGISIKEEAVGIEGEIPEAITFPSIKTEQEVRVQGVCEMVAAYAY